MLLEPIPDEFVALLHSQEAESANIENAAENVLPVDMANLSTGEQASTSTPTDLDPELNRIDVSITSTTGAPLVLQDTSVGNNIAIPTLPPTDAAYFPFNRILNFDPASTFPFTVPGAPVLEHATLANADPTVPNVEIPNDGPVYYSDINHTSLPYGPEREAVLVEQHRATLIQLRASFSADIHTVYSQLADAEQQLFQEHDANENLRGLLGAYGWGRGQWRNPMGLASRARDVWRQHRRVSSVSSLLDRDGGLALRARGE